MSQLRPLIKSELEEHEDSNQELNVDPPPSPQNHKQIFRPSKEKKGTKIPKLKQVIRKKQKKEPEVQESNLPVLKKQFSKKQKKVTGKNNSYARKSNNGGKAKKRKASSSKRESKISEYEEESSESD